MNLKNCTIASFVLVLLAAVLSLSAQDVVKQNKHQGPPILGPHWAKGMHPARKGGGSPNMTFHGGTVLTTTTTQAIFWGSSWATNAGDKISGMDSWYEGFVDRITPRPRMNIAALTAKLVPPYRMEDIL
jgi:hypothetical protein